MTTAQQLHEWYLEATQELNPDSYNPDAQKNYSDLTEEQRYISAYIAHRVENMLSEAQLDAYDKGYDAAVDAIKRQINKS